MNGDLAADALTALVGEASPRLALAALFVITTLLGLFISNTATAVLVAPVALAIADELGASPYPFAMIVALAASAAFMTPVSSPVNTLVVGPGNYAFGDFVRVGVPFTAIVLVVSVLLVPLLLPLHESVGAAMRRWLVHCGISGNGNMFRCRSRLRSGRSRVNPRNRPRRPEQ
jgi:di/tricarboxylate transporter